MPRQARQPRFPLSSFSRFPLIYVLCTRRNSAAARCFAHVSAPHSARCQRHAESWGRFSDICTRADYNRALIEHFLLLPAFEPGGGLRKRDQMLDGFGWKTKNSPLTQSASGQRITA
ncbi:protein of unknown function [Burkholderia multivorans]